MSSGSERVWDLLIQRATEGVSEAEGRELEALLKAHPEIDPEEIDRAAAAVDQAMSGPATPMPESIRARLYAKADEFASGSGTEPIAVIGKRRVGAWGWLAAAACLALAVAGWWSRLAPRPSPAEQRQMLLARADTSKADWGAWDNPAVPGVSGDVVWNEASQTGYMRFTGLPAPDPANAYQLWIIDDRGMEQRISGAIFGSPGAGQEVVVPITPQIHTRNAAAFAVTVENAGGTWVSDMKRRVVIASLKKQG